MTRGSALAAAEPAGELTAAWRRRLGHPIAAALGAALLAVVLYGPTVGYDFTYDDIGVIVEDARLADPSFGLGAWVAPWRPGGSAAPASRPLTSFTFWAQHQVHGPDPYWFHLVNIVLFTILCAQIAMLGRRWLGTMWAAWGAGLLFAAHPIHVEAVANVVGRAELLAAIFAVGALQLWLRWRPDITWTRAAAIGGCVLLAGLGKEHGYPIAAVIGLAEAAARRVEGRPIFARPVPWRAGAAIAIVAALAAGQRAAMHAGVGDTAGYRDVAEIDNPLRTASTAEQLVTPVMLVGKAAQVMAAPVEQSPDYSPRVLMPTRRLDDPLVLLGGAAIAAWALAVWWAWRGRRAALGPLLAIAVAWGIPSNTPLLHIGTIFGERLLTMLSIFVPLALLGLVAGRSAQPITGRASDRSASATTAAPPAGAWALALVIGAATFGYSIATIFYMPAWRDHPTLVLYTVETKPHSGRFQGFFVGHLLRLALEQPDAGARRGLLDRAEHHARLALENWPRQHVPYEALGLVAEERGDASAAREHYRMARRISPLAEYAAAGLARLGDLPGEDALRRRAAGLAEALEGAPDDAELALDLADTYVLLRRPEPALELYDRFLDIRQTTDVDRLDRYAEALLAERRYERIIAVYRRRMEIEPPEWWVLNDAALVAMAGQVEMDQARAWIDRAIELNPDAPQPWGALGEWHRLRGDPEAAEQALRQALRRSSPDDPYHAHYRLMLDRLLGR